MVHRARTIVVTRFVLVPPYTLALTLVGGQGRVVYLLDWWDQRKRVVPALEAAGFVISPDEVARLYPGVRRQRP